MLSTAEKFFIEQHSGLSAAELAKQLKLPKKGVQAYLDSISKKKATPAKSAKLANFETGKGVTSMTGEQSMDDDTSPKPPNKQFFQDHEKNIHKIRPKEPFQ